MVTLDRPDVIRLKLKLGKEVDSSLFYIYKDYNLNVIISYKFANKYETRIPS